VSAETSRALEQLGLKSRAIRKVVRAKAAHWEVARWNKLRAKSCALDSCVLKVALCKKVAR
jgi:hypothetical protein